ncbi:SDR family NAD(P)-dependent oxidoreductase [Pedobacter sp. ISL-68]|uniref:SDR family NAD(P)-dependent oxidoreductase n=1 Tax=unclassified Pedobacter TaxID=2628915 RepID=UPI001BEA26D3|nr:MULTISPECIES: SDR family NAD(P)-dependent oxidoreductase [unclassified Pedobacter]MBT2560256.1 SDR family NAD(P)-dependent oxidoreductase [Pedobacter sp. ISL-64]MBT2589236.1 SDR family NAD(P)-dependent oxidoreductase [Pedobacter sp. ISL-68]
MKKHKKIWLIVGGIEGLGLASIKYILSKDAFVIALTPDTKLFKENTRLSHPNLCLIGYGSMGSKTLSLTLASIHEQFGPIDYYINHQSAEDLARQWETSKLSLEDFEKSFSQQTVWLSEEVLAIMAKSNWAHIFFVSFKEKTQPLEQIADARISAIKTFVQRHEKDFKNWDIKLSMIDEDNCMHNFEACDNVFKLPFEN